MCADVVRRKNVIIQDESKLWIQPLKFVMDKYKNET